jgi:hypothetical protein
MRMVKLLFLPQVRMDGGRCVLATNISVFMKIRVLGLLFERNYCDIYEVSYPMLIGFEYAMVFLIPFFSELWSLSLRL